MSLHIVEFDKYCKDCKHYEEDESCDECDDCLDNSFNEDSRKPTRFEEK